MGVGEGSVGEELEREGMSSSRNWDRAEFTLVVDMWTGIRTEWDKFERGRARRMYRTRYVDFWFHSFCLVRCTDLYRLRSMLYYRTKTPVATIFNVTRDRMSRANWGGTRPRVDHVGEWKSSTPHDSGHHPVLALLLNAAGFFTISVVNMQHRSVPSAHIPSPALIHTAPQHDVHRVRHPLLRFSNPPPILSVRSPHPLIPFIVQHPRTSFSQAKNTFHHSCRTHINEM